MPGFGSKGDVSKKDMNFFSEFTEKAAKMARMLAYAVVAIIAVVGVMVVLVIMAFAQNIMVEKDIKDIKKELNSDTYATVEYDYAKLQAEIAEKTQYRYALGEMTNTVNNTPAAKVDLTSTIKACIPNEALVESYSLSGTVLTISGRAFSYYSAGEFVNYLQQNGVFTSIPSLTVNHVDAQDIYDATTKTVNLINTYYAYSIQGTLTNDIHVTVKRFLDGDTVTAIGSTEISTANAADGSYTIPGEEQFSFSSIKTATLGAETYTLSYIMVDGKRISDEDFAKIYEADSYTGFASADTTISLYYVAGGES